MSLISYLTKIHFADDVLEEALRAETQGLRLERPLLLADRSAADTGLVERIVGCLRGITEPILLAAPPGNATEAGAIAASEAYRAEGCDGVVAVGSGASIDLGKAVAILVSHDGPLRSYAAADGGIARIRNVLPPLVAVPTAAGPGAEVGRSAGIIFEDGRKLQLVSPFLVPRVAICDPTLTLSTPPDATAQGGIDALTHCIETYLSTAYNPPADAMALDGVRRACASLRRAVDRGSDLDARRELMVAALQGALALQKGLGGAHAMSHALEGLRHSALIHGTLNAILLPHVLDFNAPAVADRYEALRGAAAVGGGIGLSDAVRRLAASVGLPSRLGDLGLGEAAIGRAAPLAADDHSSSTNPRRAGVADYLGLMRAAL